MDQLDLLNKIYASNVILIAAQLKQEKEKQGVRSTADFISNAVTLIDQTALRLSSSR